MTTKVFHWCKNPKCGRTVSYDFIKLRNKKNYSCIKCKRKYTKKELGLNTNRNSGQKKYSDEVNKLAAYLRSTKYQKIKKSERIQENRYYDVYNTE